MLLAAAAASITKDELRNHVDVLADDTFEGREAGSRGGRAAANYILQKNSSGSAQPRPATAGPTFSRSRPPRATPRPGRRQRPASSKSKLIVIGAHYDHVGYGRANNSYGPSGYIHNGADDNASGVAGLLEVLDAIERLPTPPRRSILFACWDGEEGGLLGSRTWVGQPTLPLASVVQHQHRHDRPDEKRPAGDSTAPAPRRACGAWSARPTTPARPPWCFDWKLKADSDHWPFYERRIPFVMFHTGLHGEYHRPSDDAHLINHDGLAAATQMIFQLAMQARRCGPRRPPFAMPRGRKPALRPIRSNNLSRRSRRAMACPFASSRATCRRSSSPASRPARPPNAPGSKPGDRLLEFQGQPIRDEAQLSSAVARGSRRDDISRSAAGHRNAAAVQSHAQRRPHPRRHHLALGRRRAGHRHRQPSHLRLRRPRRRPESRRPHLFRRRPPFQSQDEFVALLTNATSPLEMLIERDGRLHTATLTLIDEPPAAE